MKKLTILIAIIILISSIACEQKFDIEAEENTLNSLVEKTHNSLQNGDIEFPKSFFSDDWELFLTMEDIQVCNNKEDWEMSFDDVFKPAGNVKITVNNAKWTITASLAISKSEETWEMGIHTQTIKTNNLVTRIYEKRNGEWCCIHVHQSGKQ